MAVDQRGQRAVVTLDDDLLPGHQPGPGLDVEDHVLERRAQRPVADVELLIELRVGQTAAQIQELIRGPAVVLQQAIEQIDPILALVSILLWHDCQRRLHALFPVLAVADRAVDDVLTGRQLRREDARLA